MRSRTPALSARASSKPQRLVGDAVLGVVEVQVHGVDGQALPARGIGGEELAQRDVGQRRVVRGKSGPGRGPVDPLAHQLCASSFFSSWPPNSLRIAERIFPEYSALPREANRSNSGKAVMTMLPSSISQVARALNEPVPFS